jgi:hypothetical protein
VAMPGELHIPRFGVPQRMDAEIPAAVHNESSLLLLSSGWPSFL